MEDEVNVVAAVQPTRASRVSLREITEDSLGDVLRLSVAENQKCFVASNAVSIAQAHFAGDSAWFRAIYADDVPVGFVMLEVDFGKPEYFLWRFMIDARFQRLGFGHQALDLLVEHVRGLPGASELLVSYEPGEGNPGPFYHCYGFVDDGRFIDGEYISVLKL